MSARVHITTHNSRQRSTNHQPDSASIAEARVRLKLRSIAYAETRVGFDAGPELGGHAAAALCVAAIHYYVLLDRGRDPQLSDKLRRAWEDDVRAQASTGAHADLRLCAVAYVGSRHGKDSHSEFIRSAIRELCQSAARYCQTLLGRDVTVEVVDDTMSLDDGR